MTTTADLQTLVLGATGKTGRRVATRLSALGVPVRLGSRSGDVPFDWEDRSTWVRALDGMEAVYVAYAPDIAVPGAAQTVHELTEQATRAGVRRLVLLSGRGEQEAEHAEQVVMASGLEWTILRASWFTQNFSEGHFLQPLRDGELVLPVGDVGEPFVDVDDIADVAVAALTDDRHAGQLYELTGPRLLSFADAVEEIAVQSGRPLAFVPVPMDVYEDAARAAGEDEDVLWVLRYLFTEVLDGRNASLGYGVERALGRVARDFRDVVRSAAAQGVWDDAEVRTA